MPIVFVHGITVRLDRFDRLLNVVKRGFADSGCRLEVSGCYWGDLGRSASYTGVSIPGFAEGLRGIGETRTTGGSGGQRAARESAGDTSALLMLLLEDPLAELADLCDSDQFKLEPVGFRPVPSQVETRNATLSAAEESISAQVIVLAGTFRAPDAAWSAADVRQLVRDVFDAAASADRGLDVAAMSEPMSRALTAGVCRIVTAGDDWPGEFRWNDAAAAIDDALNQEFGGQRRGMMRKARGQALTYALRHGLRAKVMPPLSLFLGDVMAWFRNRDDILGRVEDAVTDAGTAGPLVLVCHSLGGIIAFDYCAQANRDVALLATVGSQPGFFGELGVLNVTTRRPDGKLVVPAQVGMWRNFYDSDDALSFLAAPVLDRVTDIMIDTHAPFPIAHSEYWNLRDTYQKLTAAVNSL